jgi:hypothetical protein
MAMSLPVAHPRWSAYRLQRGNIAAHAELVLPRLREQHVASVDFFRGICTASLAQPATRWRRRDVFLCCSLTLKLHAVLAIDVGTKAVSHSEVDLYFCRRVQGAF